MSQAGIISSETGPVPPDVATSYTTNDGNHAVPSANNLNVYGNNIQNDGYATWTTSVNLGNTVKVNSYGTARWVVNQEAGVGTHTTIQSAINSASSGDNIFITPGTYTENLTLKAGVNLNAFDCDSSNPTVLIIGNHTFSTGGSFTITNMGLASGGIISSNIFTVSGSSAAFFTVYNCNFNSAVGGTFIMLYSNNNASSFVTFNACFSDTTGGGAVDFVLMNNPTPAGTVIVDNCYMDDGGFSINGCDLIINSSNIGGSITVVNTGSSLQVYNSVLNGSNPACITLGTNAGASAIYNSVINAGTGPGINFSAAATLTLSNVSIGSSNTNAIDASGGSGTLIYDNISFFGTSSQINSSITQTLMNLTTANLRANGLAYLHGGTAYAYIPTAVSYPVLTSDVIIGVTSTSSARTITMPNSGMTTGQRWTIKDESGGAATHNITISGNGADIDGSTTYVMNSNYQAVDIYWNGTNFFIV